MFKNTPAMGWNSWNTFGANINEEVVLTAAEKMVELGLSAYGYEYIVIDDCWSLRERDESGRLVADPEKFPHGMKYVADKIHALGLKFGMYSCAGTLTCAQYPGSYEHEFIDAETFASWGVDYLKYDYCFHSTSTPGHLSYKRMGIALANCGRDILFSNCSWGADDTKIWIKETGAHSFRSTGDIFDSWKSIKDLALSQMKVMEYNGVGCFNDMDMLVVGMHGSGNVGRGGCTRDEYFTHFALWCMMSSTLMIGCDFTRMTEEDKAILTNRDLIRINQDGKGSQPFFLRRMEKNVRLSNDDPYFYSNYPEDVVMLAKFLDDGKIAISITNFTDGKASLWQANFNTESVGVPESSGRTLKMRNVETGEETVVKNGIFLERLLEPHQTKVYIAEVVKK